MKEQKGQKLFRLCRFDPQADQEYASNINVVPLVPLVPLLRVSCVVGAFRLLHAGTAP
jgi:hypothetical protein